MHGDANNAVRHGILARNILKTAENYTYLTFAHPVLKPLPASGRGLERGSILSEVLNRSQYNYELRIIVILDKSCSFKRC